MRDGYAAEIVPGGTPDRPRVVRSAANRPGAAGSRTAESPTARAPSSEAPFSEAPSDRVPSARSNADRATPGPSAPHRRRPGSPSSRELASIAADDLAADDVLYRHDGILVMPSWLEIGRRESYAVRSIVRLSLAERAPPRGTAAAAVLVFVALAVLSGLHAFRGTLPFALAWGLLAASLALGLYAAHHAFVRPSAYRLDVTLADGTRIPLERRDRASLLELHRALSRAMERQRGGS